MRRQPRQGGSTLPLLVPPPLPLVPPPAGPPPAARHAPDLRAASGIWWHSLVSRHLEAAGPSVSLAPGPAPAGAPGHLPRVILRIHTPRRRNSQVWHILYLRHEYGLPAAYTRHACVPPGSRSPAGHGRGHIHESWLRLWAVTSQAYCSVECTLAYRSAIVPCICLLAHRAAGHGRRVVQAAGGGAAGGARCTPLLPACLPAAHLTADRAAVSEGRRDAASKEGPPGRHFLRHRRRHPSVCPVIIPVQARQGGREEQQCRSWVAAELCCQALLPSFAASTGPRATAVQEWQCRGSAATRPDCPSEPASGPLPVAARRPLQEQHSANPTAHPQPTHSPPHSPQPTAAAHPQPTAGSLLHDFVVQLALHAAQRDQLPAREPYS
jgi:hypothetical protein